MTGTRQPEQSLFRTELIWPGADCRYKRLSSRYWHVRTWRRRDGIQIGVGRGLRMSRASMRKHSSGKAKLSAQTVTGDCLRRNAPARPRLPQHRRWPHQVQVSQPSPLQNPGKPLALRGPSSRVATSVLRPRGSWWALKRSLCGTSRLCEAPACRVRLALVILIGVMVLSGVGAVFAQEVVIGLVCLLLGGPIIAAGIWLARRQKPTYMVFLTTSAGEVTAYEGKDRARITQIVAVTSSITAGSHSWVGGVVLSKRRGPSVKHHTGRHAVVSLLIEFISFISFISFICNNSITTRHCSCRTARPWRGRRSTPATVRSQTRTWLPVNLRWAGTDGAVPVLGSRHR